MGAGLAPGCRGAALREWSIVHEHEDMGGTCRTPLGVRAQGGCGFGEQSPEPWGEDEWVSEDENTEPTEKPTPSF